LLVLSACSNEGEPAAVDYEKLEVPTDRLANEETRARGRALFLNKCALCHGERADGNGVRRKGLSGAVANFQSSDWRANTSARQVFMIVSEGKRGTSMPAWPTLSDEEKWEVVAYVLSVAEDGP
jgi:mono/diheme cytochrome c family protein